MNRRKFEKKSFFLKQPDEVEPLKQKDSIDFEENSDAKLKNLLEACEKFQVLGFRLLNVFGGRTEMKLTRILYAIV